MADGTKVQINDLSDFGSKTSGIDTKSGGSKSGGPIDLMKDLNGTIATVLKGQTAGAWLGTNESQTFHDWYTQAIISSTSQCSQDAPKKLMALGGTATVMAANYAEGDLSQAKAMNEVVDLFNTDPSKGIDGDFNKNGTGNTNPITGKPLPPVTQEPNPVPKDHETPAQKANRQAREHQDKYGKDETWPKPPDPPKEPKTKILAPGPIGEPPPSMGPTV
jgi:hypothetical protein